MKKIIKNKIILIVILCIISCGIGVYAATTYKASDVVYNASDGTSINVNDALNELYNKTKGNGYYFSYKNGTAIYYNPVSGTKCNASEAVSTTGTKTGCMKWYTFNDDSESSTVNMILDHNTTSSIEWSSSKKNVAYEESDVKPEVDKLVSVSNWKDIPRLISAVEVAKITGKTDFNSLDDTTWYYLDTNIQTQISKSKGTSKYAWLFDYTNGCTGNGCNTADSSTCAYWTSTPSGKTGSVSHIWFVFRGGSLREYVATSCTYGIRPVITISKTKLS